uniref:Autophagy-related protein 18a-like n=1 Tax=Rhizophora mucronata TaxID=61149 RepID=A0A2P2J0I6_RHIMU
MGNKFSAQFFKLHFKEGPIVMVAWVPFLEFLYRDAVSSKCLFFG